MARAVTPLIATLSLCVGAVAGSWYSYSDYAANADSLISDSHQQTTARFASAPELAARSAEPEREIGPSPVNGPMLPASIDSDRIRLVDDITRFVATLPPKQRLQWLSTDGASKFFEVFPYEKIGLIRDAIGALHPSERLATIALIADLTNQSLVAAIIIESVFSHDSNLSPFAAIQLAAKYIDDGDSAKELQKQIFRRWSELDSDHAIKWLNDNIEFAAEIDAKFILSESMVNKSPTEAFAWAAAQLRGPMRAAQLENLASRWYDSDADNLRAWVVSQTPSSERDIALKAYAQKVRHSNVQAALAVANQISDPLLRESVVESLYPDYSVGNSLSR